MIISNLDVLLAERKLKISKVSQETGISRTTLTALSNSRAQGIQFDTLNTLCTYLHIEPSDLLVFVPFNFSVNAVNCTNYGDYFFDIVFELSVKPQSKTKETFQFSANFSYEYDDKTKTLNYHATYHFSALNSFIKSLPKIVQTELENFICDECIDIVLEQFIDEDYDYTIIQPSVTIIE